VQWAVIVSAVLVAAIGVTASVIAFVVPLVLGAAAVVNAIAGRSSPGPLRRGRRSAAATAVVMSVTMLGAAAALSEGVISPDAARAAVSLAIAASALWLAADLRWGGWVHDALARLVIELGAAEPTSLRDVLRRVLDDDALELGYTLDGATGFIDERGEAIHLPEPRSGRSTMPLISDGEQIGVLVRSAGAESDPALVAGVAAVAVLAVGNARLQAAVAEQLADLSASRGRLVTAVEAQRTRLQTDVADRIAPKLEDVARAIPGTPVAATGHLHAEVAMIIEQLQDLAAGVGPTDVAIHGLPHALRSLAAQCPLEVTVSIDTPGVVGDMAATAFFVVAEGLANASKHAHATRAWVDVRVARDELLVDIRDDGVGGAVVAAGSGLGGLRERLRERGGSIEIRVANEGGVRLVARLPLQPRIGQIPITDLVGTA
jgi:hypothetical protein